MKHNKRKTLLLIILLFLIIVISCPNSPLDDYVSSASGFGSFTLRLTDNAGRTILPDTPKLSDISSLSLKFTEVNTGGIVTSLIDPFDGNDSPAVVVVLPVGYYTLAVEAFIGSRIASRGILGTVSDPIYIKDGENRIGSVSLLTLLLEPGTFGTFSWAILLNTASFNLDTAKMIVYDINDPSSILLDRDLLIQSERNGSIDLLSGIYNVEFELTQAGRSSLVWYELMYIYSGLDSRYIYSFSDEDFLLTHYVVTFNYDCVELKDGIIFGDGKQSYKHGDTISSQGYPPDPARSGYRIFDWYTEPGFINKYDFTQKIFSDMTLYAMWVGEQVFDVVYETILDNGPELSIDDEPVTDTTEIIIFRGPVDGRDKVTVKVSNADEYEAESIKWYYNNAVIQTGSEITLDANDVSKAYSIPGLKLLAVEAVKNGKTYASQIVFEVTALFNVYFDTGDPDQNWTEEVQYRKKATEPADPPSVLKNHSAGLYRNLDLSNPDLTFIFTGWYLNNVKWDFDNPVTHDIQLKAHYKADSWIDLSAVTGVNDIEKAFNYVSSPSNASNGVYTFLVDNNYSFSVALSISNGQIHIVSLDRERVLNYNGNLNFVNVSSSGSLIIGNNITLSGGAVSASPVSISGGSFSMKEGARITGFSSSANTGIVNITGGTFNMEGGEISGNTITNTGTGAGVVNIENTGAVFNMSGGAITGNRSNSSAVDANGGVTLNSGTFNFSGGGISGNFRGQYIPAIPGDILIKAPQADAFKMSANASAGYLTFYAAAEPLSNPPVINSSSVTLDNWDGSLIFNLIGNAADINDVVALWNKRQLVRGATQNNIDSFFHMDFISTAASIASKPILDSHQINSSGLLAPRNAQTPVIESFSPAVPVSCLAGSTMNVFSVTAAEITDDGTLSYQWYRNERQSTIGGTAVPYPDGTSPDCTPDTSIAGTYYYYCVITNTNQDATVSKTSSVTSSLFTITIESDDRATVVLEYDRDGDGVLVEEPYENLTAALVFINSQTQPAGQSGGKLYTIKLRANQSIAPRTINLSGYSSANNQSTYTMRPITIVAEDPVNKPVEIQLSGNGSIIIDSYTSSTYGGLRGEMSIGNGITLKGRDANTGPLIIVESAARLIIEGAEITGNINRTNTSTSGNVGGGGGIRNAGTVTMNGGKITGNYSFRDGGGIHNTGTFNMTGGEISGNSADQFGGGISNGTVTIGSNGDLSFTAGTFSMTGGTITGNNAGRYGGGIYFIPPAPSGTSGTITLGGSAEINGNNSLMYGINNVHLERGRRITVSSPGSMSVGISGIGEVTNSVTGTFFADDSINFTLEANNVGTRYELKANAAAAYDKILYIDLYNTSTGNRNTFGNLEIYVNKIKTAVIKIDSTSNHYFFVNNGDSVETYWVTETSAGTANTTCAFVMYDPGKPLSPAFNTFMWSGTGALVYRLRTAFDNIPSDTLLRIFEVEL